MNDSETEGRTPSHAWFTATHWSLVWRATEADTQCADEALENLCRTYWPPLYAYLRRKGHSPEDAKDLTQGFLSRFVHKEWLNHLHDQRGKFRSFLLAFLKNFLRDERDHATAQKRGGGKELIAVDAYETEEWESFAPVNELTAEQIYDQRWAETLMVNAMEQLRADYESRGQIPLYEQLKNLNPSGKNERSYSEIGDLLGMTEQAVKNAALRFRRRYAQFLREEVTKTVSEPGEVEEEMRYLMNVFAR